MITTDDLQALWHQQQPQQQPINPATFQSLIRARLGKEHREAARYFWLSFAFQLMIYSFATHFFIRYWGDGPLMILSAAGALLYLPLTIILLRKFKAFFASTRPGQFDLRVGIQLQYKALDDFFSFKKRFDLISVPVTALVLTVVIFSLYVPGGADPHGVSAIASAIGIALVYAIAAWQENTRHFVRPLARLKTILLDMESVV